MNVPSKYATVDVSYGEKRQHLYTPEHLSFEFHKTKAEAMKAAEKSLSEGTKMVAVLKVESLYRAKPIELEAIKD